LWFIEAARRWKNFEREKLKELIQKKPSAPRMKLSSDDALGLPDRSVL